MIQYTVQPNDTLWLLSQRFGTTVDAIRNANGLTSDALRIGQVLNIPTTATTPQRVFTIVLDPRPSVVLTLEQYLEHV